QMKCKCDETLTCSSMQVPFQASSLADACLDNPGARVPHLVELGAQLCKQALVFERESGCARHGVQQCRVLAQRWIVNERGDLAAVALEDRHRTPGRRNN